MIAALLTAGEGSVLELPVGPGVLPHAVAMYRAIAHRRPLLNGYSGYWPAGFEKRMALACRLPDATALRRLREETGLRTILVDVRRIDPNIIHGIAPYRCPGDGSARAAWEGVRASRRPDLREITRLGPLWLFRVVDPPT